MGKSGTIVGNKCVAAPVKCATGPPAVPSTRARDAAEELLALREETHQNEEQAEVRSWFAANRFVIFCPGYLPHASLKGNDKEVLYD